jgi:hypothetical protein
VSQELPSLGTVEALLREIESWPADASSAELWVPQHLTLNGDPVLQDAAMAIVVDKILGIGLFPDGLSEGAGGRLYRYARE